MKTKVCPCCDQPITGMYCKGCRKIVWKPVEQEIKYFLNTRHPEFETDCSYHNDLPQAHRTIRGSDQTVRTASHKMTSAETEAKKAEIRARMEAGKNEVLKNFGVGTGTGKSRRTEPNWMMPKQTQTVLNGDVIRPKKTSAGGAARSNEEGKRTLRIALLTAFLVVFVIVFTFVMILVINSMNGVTRSFAVPEPARETPLVNVPAPIEVPVEIEIPAVTLSPELESFLAEAAANETVLPTTPETDAATMEDWELTDADVKEVGMACNGYGHFHVTFEEAHEIFTACILDAGYDWMTYDAFSYNQFIDEYTWYETMYEYTIYNEDERAGYIEVNVDTATGEIHAIEMYASEEDGFYEVADIALKFVEQIGMASGLPAGIEFYEEALNKQQDEVFSLQYGLEVVAYQPEKADTYAQYHMAVYAPGYYGVAE